MAKLTDEELQKIIGRDLEGQVVAKREPRYASDATRSAAAHAEVQAPSLDELRRKYLGPDEAQPESTVSPFAAGAARVADNAETTVPSLRDLRRKYLGELAADEADWDRSGLDANSEAKTKATADDEIVLTRHAAGSDADDRTNPPKAAVVSGAQHKVIGVQG